MFLTGRCACGAIEFEVEPPFLATAACHCDDCQKASGGGPNYVALAPKDALRVVRGEPREYRKAGDSGAQVARAFCGDCGTPLWTAPDEQDFLTIKVGALDDRANLGPQMHVFEASAPAWHPMASPDRTGASEQRVADNVVPFRSFH